MASRPCVARCVMPCTVAGLRWLNIATATPARTPTVHAFVALAASSAVVAQRPGAQALLDDAIDIIDTYFWSESEGAMRESFNRDWSEEEA